MSAAADAPAHRVVAISDRNGRQVSQACARPPQMADVAQARLFDDLLEAELVGLQQAIDALDHWWHRHCAKTKGDNHQPPESLVRHCERLWEVRCLLAALRTRFPPLTDQAITRVQT
jgi:hypothetical protein